MNQQRMNQESKKAGSKREPRAASRSSISPSPPSDGGEGWGEEVRFYWFPLSSVLPTRSSRGEDGELDAALARAGERDKEGLRLETCVGPLLLCLAREPGDDAVPDLLISRCRSTCIWIGARSGQEMFRRETAVVFVTRTS